MRFLLLVLLWPSSAVALERMAFAAESVEGSGWLARDVRIELGLPKMASGAAEIEIGALELPPPIGKLSKLRLHCPKLEMTAQQIGCRAASLAAAGPGLGRTPAQVDFNYLAATGALNIELRKLALYGGRMNLQLAVEDTATRLKLGLHEVSASEPSGRYATEKLVLNAQARFRRDGEQWQFKLTSVAGSGQLYVEPLFLEIKDQPLELDAEGRYDAAKNTLKLTKASLRQPQTLEAQARLSAQLKPAFKLRELEADITRAQFPAAYAYLQPFLIGTAFDALSTQGGLSGRVQMRDGALTGLDADLRDVYLHDTKERFTLDVLNGAVHWAKSGATPATQLRWRGGSAYKVPFEGAELDLQMRGSELALRAPLRQPMLGGALVVERFAATAFGEPAQKLDFEGRLEPIDLQALCTALGWPAFGGKLAGSLPRLSYSEQVVSVGGTLSAQVFDGEITVEKFRLGNPLGPRPQLSGDVRLRNIDLAQATGAFSFGRIDGRLHGDVEGLQMLNWRPVAFDAKFYTPPDDRSRHRISQRAIENISAIGGGGGATGVLSKGFLRFFDDFAYERLGLSCLLRNNRCRMSGIEPKDGGYYIVKGALVPRIDVIGYAREVNWDALLQQLRNATASTGPVIK